MGTGRDGRGRTEARKIPLVCVAKIDAPAHKKKIPLFILGFYAIFTALIRKVRKDSCSFARED
jgi:hypothetical protein